MHVIFVRARSITGIITENISYLLRKFADPTRMFSSEIQLRFSEIYVSMLNPRLYRVLKFARSSKQGASSGQAAYTAYMLHIQAECTVQSSWYNVPTKSFKNQDSTNSLFFCFLSFICTFEICPTELKYDTRTAITAY